MRALTSRFTSADAWPVSTVHGISVPPSICSPSLYPGRPWKVSEKMYGGGGGKMNASGFLLAHAQNGWSEYLHRFGLELLNSSSMSGKMAW